MYDRKLRCVFENSSSFVSFIAYFIEKTQTQYQYPNTLTRYLPSVCCSLAPERYVSCFMDSAFLTLPILLE